MMMKPFVGVCALAAWSMPLACGEPEIPFPVRARVVVYEGSDVVSGQPRFAIAERTLASLQDLSDLRGPHHRILRGGAVNIRELDGDRIAGETAVDRGATALRYGSDGGVVVARDYPSLVMLSAYYQLELILEALPRVAGWSAAEEVARRGPFEVLFEPKLNPGVEGVRGSVEIKGNAAFVVGTRLFMLARRTARESIPLGADLRVLAHEFGHALFETTFFGGRRPGLCQPEAAGSSLAARLDGEFAINGMNEGFCDFVSFAITGTTNPLAGLFEGQALDDRGLDTRFTFEDLAAEPPADPTCDEGEYCLGTLFARSLRALLLTEKGPDPDPEARGELSRQVITALAGTLDRIQAREASLPPVPRDLLDCSPPEQLTPGYDGQIAGAFLDAFVAGMPEDRRGPLCRTLVASFGPLGFPVSQRQTCGASAPWTSP